MKKRFSFRDAPWWKPLWQLVKFNVVGVSNMLLDNVLFWLLSTAGGVVYWLAKVISYTAGMMNSWFWNSRWTFASRQAANAQASAPKSKRFLLFVAVNLASLLVSLVVLALCRLLFARQPSWWMNLFLASPAAMLVNFVGNQKLVFPAAAANNSPVRPTDEKPKTKHDQAE